MSERSGWTILRALGMVIATIGAVGFGVCSLCSLGYVSDGGFGVLFWFFIAGGITALFIWMARTIQKRVDSDRDDEGR